MTCHHIDWSGLQILIDATKGGGELTYKCLLCETDFVEEEYKDLIKTIREKKEDDTLKFWRTPKGREHELAECVDTDHCPIHEGED